MNELTQLHRQIHPNFVRNGQVTSQAFRPSSGDEGKMSIYDGDMISPCDSYTHYTTIEARKSKGTMSFSVAECAGLGLPVEPSPTEKNPAHGHVDFGHLESNGAIDKMGKRLHGISTPRGWTHKADD